MGLAIYVEDQIHQREYAGKEAGACLELILKHVDADTVLAGTHLHRDTMFNSPQLMRATSELNLIGEVPSEVMDAVTTFKSILERVIRRRGYVWISGD